MIEYTREKIWIVAVIFIGIFWIFGEDVRKKIVIVLNKLKAIVGWS